MKTLLITGLIIYFIISIIISFFATKLFKKVAKPSLFATLKYFVIGVFAWWYLLFFKKPKFTGGAIRFKRLYCFECEIVMPVKYKKGWPYCSNCGLAHN